MGAPCVVETIIALFGFNDSILLTAQQGMHPILKMFITSVECFTDVIPNPLILYRQHTIKLDETKYGRLRKTSGDWL